MSTTTRFKRTKRFARDEVPDGMEELTDWVERLSPEKKDYLYELLSSELGEPDDEGTGAVGYRDPDDQGEDSRRIRRRQYNADGRPLPAHDSAPARRYAPNGMGFAARFPAAARIKVLP
jgi:hypothetical protein